MTVDDDDDDNDDPISCIGDCVLWIQKLEYALLQRLTDTCGDLLAN
jgi:hypothetical protein